MKQKLLFLSIVCLAVCLALAFVSLFFDLFFARVFVVLGFLLYVTLGAFSDFLTVIKTLRKNG